MSVKRGALILATLASLSACTTVPTAMVLPGVGKPFEEFQRDDVVCRQWAARSSAQERYDIAYQQCMFARGNQIPGVIPAARPSGVPAPPAPPVSTGPR